MLNYLFNNLPIIKLIDNYSIWTIDNNKNIIIYLSNNKENALIYAAELNFNTYILLSKSLETYITCINYSNESYFKINKYIESTRIKLESIKDPEWDFFEEKILDLKIKDTDFNININKILNEICMILKLHCGDLNQITNIIKNIECKFNISKDQEFFMDEIIKNINNIFIFINIKKNTINNNYTWFNCFTFKNNYKRYIIKYIIVKPNNKNAINISKYLMNKEINNKINYIQKYN